MFKTFKRWWNRPSNIAGHVYYARLATPQGTFYKIGYTTKASLAERLNYQGCGDHRYIDREFFFTYRSDAWEIEQQLLDHFEKRLAFGKYSKDSAYPLCGSGQGELFRGDVLGLDDDAYKDAADAEPATAQRRKSFAENMNASIWMIIIGVVLLPFTLGWSLLLLAGGVAGFFGSSNERPLPARASRRPVHPPFIRSLIDGLARDTTHSADGRYGIYVDEVRAERQAKLAARAKAKLEAARAMKDASGST